MSSWVLGQGIPLLGAGEGWRSVPRQGCPRTRVGPWLGVTRPHPAVIPRTPPFAPVRRRVDNSLTCRDSSPESAEARRKHVRNVEVGGSSPLTSTKIPVFEP